MTLKIALLQLLPGKTLEEQLQLGDRSLRKGKSPGGGYSTLPQNVELWIFNSPR